MGEEIGVGDKAGCMAGEGRTAGVGDGEGVGESGGLVGVAVGVKKGFGRDVGDGATSCVGKGLCVVVAESVASWAKTKAVGLLVSRVEMIRKIARNAFKLK